MQNVKIHSAPLSVLSISLILGLATSLAQKFLPHEYMDLSGSYSIWVICAFVAGLFAISKKQSIICGAAIPLIASLVSYFTSTLLLGGGRVTAFTVLLLFIITIVAGPAMAYLAFLWKQKNERGLIVAPVLVSAIFISEGLAYLVNLSPDILGYAFILLGTVAFAALYRKRRNPILVAPMIGAVIPASILIYFAYIISAGILLTTFFWNSGLSDL
jgi:hypothetical protein